MKILVFIKHVPDTETRVRLAGSGAQAQALDESDFKYMVNPYDEFAIEEAIQVRDRAGAGEVVVVSLGPVRCQEAIRKALAMGADAGIWIGTEGTDERSLDSGIIAAALARIVQEEQPHVVFTGQKAIDDDCGHIGPMIAEKLGWPHVQVVNRIEWNGDFTRANVSREVEGGMVEVYDLAMPAVLGAHKSLNQPRFPSLPGIIKAKKKPLRETKLADLMTAAGISLQPTTRVVSYALPPEKAPGKVFKGKPVGDMVKDVVGLLRSEAKVI